MLIETRSHFSLFVLINIRLLYIQLGPPVPDQLTSPLLPPLSIERPLLLLQVNLVLHLNELLPGHLNVLLLNVQLVLQLDLKRVILLPLIDLPQMLRLVLHVPLQLVVLHGLYLVRHIRVKPLLRDRHVQDVFVLFAFMFDTFEFILHLVLVGRPCLVQVEFTYLVVAVAVQDLLHYCVRGDAQKLLVRVILGLLVVGDSLIDSL